MRAGPIIWIAAILLTAPPILADPAPLQVLTTDHFRFHHQASQRPLIDDLLGVAQAYRVKLAADLGATLPDPLDVFVVEGLVEMRRAAPEGSRVPSWAAGMAFSRHSRILLRTDSRAGQAQDLQSVFVHELAHLALSHAVSNQPLPRWFHEGFAIYQSGEWSMGRVTALASGAVSDRLFSLQALTDSFPSAPPEVDLAYAQSIDFVAFLLKRYGQKTFHELISLLGRGWSFVNAAEEAYDTSIFRMEQDWHADLKMRFTWIPILTGTATLWFLAALILIAAYLRKKRSRALAIEAMDDEDDEGPPTPLTPTSP